jgi:hypothetical protein
VYFAINASLLPIEVRFWVVALGSKSVVLEKFPVKKIFEEASRSIELPISAHVDEEPILNAH